MWYEQKIGESVAELERINDGTLSVGTGPSTMEQLETSVAEVYDLYSYLLLASVWSICPPDLLLAGVCLIGPSYP